MMSGHGHGATTPADPLLAAALQEAVPAAILHLNALPDDQRATAMNQWRNPQTIAEQGDTLRYSTTGAAEAFTHLALGLAVLAHAPGGITAFSQHWCTNHHACQQAAAIAAGTATDATSQHHYQKAA